MRSCKSAAGGISMSTLESPVPPNKSLERTREE
jgi:hypothetical protein